MKTSDLLFALKLAQPCVVGVDFIPVLQHFCFDKKQVFAFDEISAIVVSLKTDLHCGVRADTLLQLAALGAEDVTLTQGEDKVEFVSGSTTATLPMLPPDEFAFKDPGVPKGVSFNLTNDLFTALQICAAGVGKDPHHREQTGVLLVTGKAPALYARDETSLVRCTLSEAIGTERRAVLIPKSVCDQVKHLIGLLACAPEDVTVTLSKETIAVEFKHAEWTARLVGTLLTDEVNLKEYERTVNTAADGLALMKLDDEFVSAVEKVAVVLSNEINGECLLDLSDGNLEVHGEGTLGKATTILKARDGLKTSAALAKAKATTTVDPERLTRYRDRLSFLAFDAKHVAMYDNKEPDKAFLSYVSACY